MVKGRADTPEKKELTMQELAELWKEVPDLRLGQFLTTIISKYKGEIENHSFESRLFYIEDEDVVKTAEAFVDEVKMNKAMK